MPGIMDILNALSGVKARRTPNFVPDDEAAALGALAQGQDPALQQPQPPTQPTAPAPPPSQRQMAVSVPQPGQQDAAQQVAPPVAPPQSPTLQQPPPPPPLSPVPDVVGQIPQATPPNPVSPDFMRRTDAQGVTRDAYSDTGKVYDPALSGDVDKDISSLEATRNALMAEPLRPSRRGWKELGGAALAAAAPVLAQGNLLGGLGAAAAGAGAQAIAPKTWSDISRKRQLSDIDRQLAPLLTQQQRAQQQEEREFNREYKREVLGSTIEEREARHEEIRARQKQARLNAIFNNGNRRRVFRVAELSATDKKLLQEEGYDLSNMDNDFRNGNVTIGGVRFERNPKTGELEQIVAKDAAGNNRNTLETIELPNLNGQRETLKVTASEKARILANLEANRIQAVAVAKRQEDAQGFNASETEKKRQFEAAEAEKKRQFEAGETITKDQLKQADAARRGLTALQADVQAAQEASAKEPNSASTKAKWDAVYRNKQALKAKYGHLPRFNEILQQISPDE